MMHYRFLLILLGDCMLALKDSDICLQSQERWYDSNQGGETCASSQRFCDTHSKDLRRCCPQTCKNSKPFTQDVCNKANGLGECIYPFDTFGSECEQNKKSANKQLTDLSGKINYHFISIFYWIEYR